MDCPYCDTGRSFVPSAIMCAGCKDQFDWDDIELGAKAYMKGHTVDCSYQIPKTGKCTCDK